MKQTTQPKGKDINHTWHEVDANGQVLGRLSSYIAGLLMGKNKSNYAPHLDMGDWVVVKNAKTIKLTGQKINRKYIISTQVTPKVLRRLRSKNCVLSNRKKL